MACRLDGLWKGALPTRREPDRARAPPRCRRRRAGSHPERSSPALVTDPVRGSLQFDFVRELVELHRIDAGPKRAAKGNDAKTLGRPGPLLSGDAAAKHLVDHLLEGGLSA